MQWKTEFIVINQEKRTSYNKSSHFTSLFHISWINVWKCESETIYQESGLEISKIIFQYLIITDPKEMKKCTQKIGQMSKPYFAVKKEFIVINQEKRISYNKSSHFTSLFHISWINVWKCESETIYKGSGIEISKLIFTCPKALEKVNSDAKLKKNCVINSWSIVLLHIIFSLSYIKTNNIQHYDIQLLFCAKKNLWKAPTSHSMPVLKCLKMWIWNHLPVRIRNFQNNFPIFNYYRSKRNEKVYSKNWAIVETLFCCEKWNSLS